MQQTRTKRQNGNEELFFKQALVVMNKLHSLFCIEFSAILKFIILVKKWTGYMKSKLFFGSFISIFAVGDEYKRQSSW